jgi:hypothetical protein
VTVQLAVRYQPVPKSAPDSAATAGNQPPTPIHDRESIGVKWSAHDDNDDQLVYSVYYRGDRETRWLLLKDDLSDKFYSFDAGLLPDGGYTIKVVASDAPSHSPGEALSTERESDRFEVDTTPPQIQNLATSIDGNRIHVTFRAADNFSPIKRAEYSLDAGDWQYVEPKDKISDSQTENYDFTIALPETEKLAEAPAPKSGKGKPPAPPPVVKGGEVEHVIVVRAYDRFDNMGTAKTLIRK